MFIIPLLLGLVVGLVSSILGLGGGILLVPILPLVTDLSRKDSVFVSLSTILVIVSVNSYSFFQKNKINLKSVWVFGPLTGLGAAVSAYFISPHFSDNDLRLVLATILLLWGGINLKKVLVSKKENKVEDAGSLSSFQLFYYFCLAFLAGVLSGLLGIGSGLILSMVLVGIFWVKDEQISPSSNGIMVFTTFFATLVYLLKSPSLDRTYILAQAYTLPLVVGAIASSFFGRKYQHLLSRQWRAIALISLLFILSIKTFFS